MKIIRYLYNLIRLGKMKICRKYQGSIVQGIPILTEIRSDSGLLFIDGKLSCRTGAYLSAGTGRLSIGRGCFFNQNVMIVSKEEIVIGNNVIIGPNVVIVDHDHNYKVNDQKNSFTATPIHIGDNVWIGANVTIMKGTSIGEGSVIGAGVVLKGEYPANTVIYEKADIVMRPIERKKNE